MRKSFKHTRGVYIYIYIYEKYQIHTINAMPIKKKVCKNVKCIKFLKISMHIHLCFKLHISLHDGHKTDTCSIH